MIHILQVTYKTLPNFTKFIQEIIKATQILGMKKFII